MRPEHKDAEEREGSKWGPYPRLVMWLGGESYSHRVCFCGPLRSTANPGRGRHTPRVAGMRLHLGFSAWEGHSAELPSQSHSLNEPSSRENCFLSKVRERVLLVYSKGQLFLPPSWDPVLPFAT